MKTRLMINGLCPDAFSFVCIDKYMYHQWEEIVINDDCISKPFFWHGGIIS